MTTASGPASRSASTARSRASSTTGCRDDRITFTHAEVDDAYEGQGLGSTLASYVLDAARDRKLEVFPACPFIAEYIKRHPDDHLDLVPEHVRDKYQL